MSKRTFYIGLGVIAGLIIGVIMVSIYLKRQATAELAAKKYAASIQGEVTRLATLDTEVLTLTKT